MKWSNEELVDIAENARMELEQAIEELEGVEEYKDILNTVKEALTDLNTAAEEYEEAYAKECRQEEERANREYERSVL